MTEELRDIEYALDHMFPGLSPTARPAVKATLITALTSYTMARESADHAVASTARLILFRTGLHSIIFPPIFHDNLNQALIRVNLHHKSDTDSRIESLEEAIHACDFSNRPLEAALLSDLSRSYSQRADTAGGSRDREQSFRAAMRSYDIAGHEATMPADEQATIMSSAIESIQQRSRGQRDSNLGLAQYIGSEALSRAETQAPTRQTRVQVAMAQSNLSGVLIARGRDGELRIARKLLEAALGAYDRFLGPHHQLSVSTAGNLVYAYRELDERRTEQLLERAIEVGESHWPEETTRQNLDPRLLTVMAGSLSNAYRVRTNGDYSANRDRAIQLAEIAVQYAESAFGKNSHNAIGALLDLSRIYHGSLPGRHQDKIDRASEMLEELQARALTADVKDDTLDQARLLGAVADFAADNAVTVEELRDAVVLHVRALHILQTISGLDRREVLQNKLNLGLTLSRIALFQQGVGVVADSESLARSDALLGEIITQTRASRANSDILFTALQTSAIHELTRSIDSGAGFDVDSMPSAVGELLRSASQVSNLVDYNPHSMRVLGSLLTELGVWDAASTFYEAALRVWDKMYQGAVSLETRTRMVVDSGGLAIEAAWCHIMVSREEKAWHLLEQSKSRWMKSRLLLNELAVEGLAACDSRLAADIDELSSELAILETQEMDSASSLAARAAFAPVGSAGMNRTIRMSALRDRLDGKLALAKELGFDSKLPNVDWKEIRTSTHGCPLLYVATAVHGTLALLIRDDGTTEAFVDRTFRHDDMVHLLRGNPDSLDPIERLGYVVALQDDGLADGVDLVRRKLKQLFDDVSASLQEGGDVSVGVVGCGGLTIVPLDLMGSTPMCDFVDVSYAPSGGVRALKRRGTRFESVPDTYVGLVGDGNLPWARIEVGSVAGLFPHRTVYAVNDPIASLGKSLSGAGYIHFACHGTYIDADPLRSAIIMGERGSLTLGELIRDTRLANCSLVVVAACDTAAITRLPDEALTFASGFLFAGASAVIGCAWPVDDLATCLLVERLFQGLRCGQSADQALGRAKAWLRSASRKEVLDRLRRIRDSADLILGVEELTADLDFMGSWLRSPKQDHPFENPAYWGAFQLIG